MPLPVFSSPASLWALVLLVPGAWLVLHAAAEKAARWHGVRGSGGGSVGRRELFHGALALLALAALILGLARFRPDAPAAGACMVVLDESASMSAVEDGEARRARALQLLTALRRADPGRELGLVTVSGEARLVLPLTADRVAWDAVLESLAVGVAQGGTPLDRGLELARARIAAAGGTGRILLLSDGEQRGPLDALWTQAERARQQGVAIDAVCIGARSGTQLFAPDSADLPVPLTEATGAVVVSHAHPEVLAEVARRSGGRLLSAVVPLSLAGGESLAGVAATRGFLVAAWLLWLLETWLRGRS